MDAALATDKAIDKARGARGRKDSTGTEVVIKTKPLKDNLKDARTRRGLPAHCSGDGPLVRCTLCAAVCIVRVSHHITK